MLIEEGEMASVRPRVSCNSHHQWIEFAYQADRDEDNIVNRGQLR